MMNPLNNARGDRTDTLPSSCGPGMANGPIAAGVWIEWDEVLENAVKSDGDRFWRHQFRESYPPILAFTVIFCAGSISRVTSVLNQAENSSPDFVSESLGASVLQIAA